MKLLEQIRAAGVAGCGGAGFPAHVKLAAQCVDTLILNGAECEPLLRTDRWLMKNKAAELLCAITAVKEQLGAAQAVIALKESYHDEIAALQQAIAAADSHVTLHCMESFYPAGDEQVQVFEVTGRVVPPGGIPLDVGCVVSNVATMHAVYQAMQGRPFTQKYLTISGAVSKPCVIKAPMGTAFADCLALAGGTDLADPIIISGGPMMGKPFSNEEAQALHVTKTTSGFLVLPKSTRLYQYSATSQHAMRSRAKSACIQCSFCTQLCPRWLLGHPLEPHKVMRHMARGPLEQQLDNPVLRAAQYCCECGVCELIACPMQLNPRGINVQIKQMLAQQGLRPLQGEVGLQCRPYRKERAIPTSRAAQRAGVSQWHYADVSTFLQAEPQEVTIALNSHIGAPALPVVSVGQRVTWGQCIAEAPQGKLGVSYHASIEGMVSNVGESIVIKREG